MKTITQNEAQLIVARLASKELTFGCWVKIFGEKEKTRLVGQIESNVYLLENGRQHYGKIWNRDNYEPVIGHPIHLHDVLAKIDAMKLSSSDLEKAFPNALSNSQKRRGVTLHQNNIDIYLTSYWRKCDLKSSLQQILAEAETTKPECIDPGCQCGKFPLRNDTCEYKATLKAPASELFILLQGLGL